MTIDWAKHVNHPQIRGIFKEIVIVVTYCNSTDKITYYANHKRFFMLLF